MRVSPKAWLCGGLWGLVSMTGGCGAAEDLWHRAGAWWSDDTAAGSPGSEGTTGAAPDEQAAIEGLAVATEGSPTSSVGTSGASSPALGSGSGRGTSGPVEASTGPWGGSTTIPMSFARPNSDESGPGTETSGAGTETSGVGTVSEGTGGGEDGSGEDTDGSTDTSTGGSALPTGGDLACLEGTWDIDDFSTYFRRVIRVQAHGRAVRSLGSSGRYTLRFEGAKVHGEARNLRLRYAAQLADRDVRYKVVIDGVFDSTVRIEGTDRLRVMPTTGSTLRAREIAQFEGGKKQTRRPRVPVEGLYELDCGPKRLELRPIEDGKTREAIRFTRP